MWLQNVLQNFLENIRYKLTHNIIVLNQFFFQLVKITLALITEICFWTKFISTIQTTTTNFIILFVDNRLMKYWTRHKLLIKMRTKIKTVCFCYFCYYPNQNIEIKFQQYKRRIYDLVKNCPKISTFIKHFLSVNNRRMNKQIHTATTYNTIAKLTWEMF